MPGQVTVLGGKAIGARIEVWWPMDETWFACAPFFALRRACHACMFSPCCVWALLTKGSPELSHELL